MEKEQTMTIHRFESIENLSLLQNQYSFWIYRNDHVESLNLFIRPIIADDLLDLKPLFNQIEIFRRAVIDFAMYYFSFRPKYSYIITSKFGHLAHGSLKKWVSHHSAILMLGLIYVRSDYRKFGFGELITNYLLKLHSDPSMIIHVNVPSKCLSFYVRHDFQLSFSLLGFSGKLSEFFEVESKRYDEEIDIQSIESCDILDLASYDGQIYPSYRIEYFEQLREHHLSIAGYVAYARQSKEILGYVVLNFSQEFIKCGPLYAENAHIALRLLQQCAAEYDGTMLLALPEQNRSAVKFFESKSFQRTDRLHRLIKGNDQSFSLEHFQRIWSITDDWLSLI